MILSGLSLDLRGQLTGRDAQSSEEVVDDSPDGCLQLQRHPEGLYAAVDRNAEDKEDIEPVDMLVPVAPGHLGVGNVHLLGLSRPGAGCLYLGRHGGVV